MKKKHIPVILFSSGIVIVVFLTTLSGYGLYTQFKKDAFTVGYRDSIHRITADIFRKDLVFSDVAIALPEDGGENPVFKGTLKNNAARSLAGILVEVSFSDDDGRVLYKEWIRPLPGQSFAAVPFSVPAVSEDFTLLPGESFKFVHVMRNCPEYLVKHTSMRRGFAKRDVSKDISFKYSIKELKVL
ncbi:MAG: hypothetical protein WCV56_03245 [Candidatus Omnitrophota bacterium]